MSEFRFGPATEEYARSYEIVRAIRSEFESDLDKYFAELKRSIEISRLPAPIRETTGHDAYGTYRYWRLTTQRRAGSGRLHIWFYPHRPGPINDGFLSFTVGTSERHADWLAHIQALRDDSRFAHYARPSTGEWWRPFCLQIQAPPESLVSTPAAVLRDFLVALWEIDQGWQDPSGSGNTTEERGV